MAIPVGTKLGSVKITALLGKGGMGEVYRAQDTKLKRDVAVKILPDEFARDPDRVARFQREAEVLASLNYPNIAAIHSLEEAEGTRFLVMELVEGDTLAERIARGRLPFEDALNIGKNICEALEAAHEKGIVHRDLKPANVKITPEGTVKVLDFGLAKALESGSSGTMLSNSPTLVDSMAGSLPGMLIGTAGYMSPEQVRGRKADVRSDIFSFGCVLYEMLTAKKAFSGDEVSDLLASVLKTEPDYDLLPEDLNADFYKLLRRCLAKNPKQRWQAIGDVRLEIENFLAEPRNQHVQIEQPTTKLRSGRLVPAIILTTLAIVAGTAAITWNFRVSPPGAVTRFSFSIPKDQIFTRAGRPVLTISPDGSAIVYVANQKLYIKRMEGGEAKPIPGTDQDVNTPFFSPDGRWIGFNVVPEAKLKKIAVTGGAAVAISDIDNPYGADWYSDNQILVGQGTKGIVRVPANGGKPETVIAAKEGETLQGPQMLPDGDTVLFTVATGTGDDRWDKAQIVAQSLKTAARKVLIDGGSDARYVPTGHIVYAIGTNLLAVPFNAKKLQVTGGPVSLEQSVLRPLGRLTGSAFFSVSRTGSLAAVTGALGTLGTHGIAMMNRDGTKKELPIPAGDYGSPRISPDGRQLTFSTQDGIVYVYDLSGATSIRRLTFEGRNDYPIWTRDGKRIVFRSDRQGEWALYWQNADGSGSADQLTRPAKGEAQYPCAWSPDGKTLIFFQTTGGGATTGANFGGILRLTLDPDRKVSPLIQIPNSLQRSAVLSPDGRWMAYQSSDFTINSSVYVEPFPPSGAKYQITSGIGTGNPLWSPDGKQLFYLAGVPVAKTVMSVNIQTQPSFTFSQPTPTKVESITQASNYGRDYDIMPDGKQFIVMPPAQPQSSDSPSAQINVVLNWFRELQERVPVIK